jgi:predicted amidophosphoribosyltransferase
MAYRIGSRMHVLGRRLLEVICPVGCMGCERPLREVMEDLCEDCWEGLLGQVAQSYCDLCGFRVGPYHVPESGCPACRSRTLRFDSIVRVGSHEGVLRHLVNSHKFQRRPDARLILGKMLASAIAGRQSWQGVDALVPIPVHYGRRLLFSHPNTVAAMAGTVGKRLSWPVAEALRVVRPGRPQRGLTMSERWENIRGRFGLCRGIDVSGACICLVDDVSTSGATLNEAAKVLKAAGARQVVAAVLSKRDPGGAVGQS